MPAGITERNRTRVVVTGMGAVTPLGVGVAAYWEGLINGRNGVGPITVFDPHRMGVRFAAQVPDFNAHDYIGRKEARRMDRYSHFAVVAALEAAQQAGLELDGPAGERAGVMMGTGIGGVTTTNVGFEVMDKRGPDRLSPFFVPMMLPNMASGQVSILLHARGPNLSHRRRPAPAPATRSGSPRRRSAPATPTS